MKSPIYNIIKLKLHELTNVYNTAVYCITCEIILSTEIEWMKNMIVLPANLAYSAACRKNILQNDSGAGICP
jgi:hypothetical protein